MAIREVYQHGSSPLHRFDPRIKALVASLLIVGVVVTPETAWPAFPLLWALLGSLAEVAELGALRQSRAAMIALPFALAALTLSFTTPGREILSIAGLTITDAGLARFFAVALKSWLAAQAALLLAMTTAFTDLLWAMSSLKVPGLLVMIIAFTYRYSFTLAEEAQRLLRARAARSGSDPARKAGRSLVWRARIAGAMIANLFLRSFERSERVYLAMCARGYDGTMRRLSPPRAGPQAYLLGLLPLAILLLIEILAFTLWS